MDRRTLLRGSLPGALGVAAALPARGAVGKLAPHVRLSCNLYSFNQVLRSGQMSLAEVLQFCAGLGFDAVDPTAYYFPGYPDRLPKDAFVYAVRRQAFQLGLDISGTGVKTDFTLPAGPRTREVAHVRRWLALATKLGAPTLRVFAGKRLRSGLSRERATRWVVSALKQCAGAGARAGVTIALQNHNEFLLTPGQILDVLRAVDSPWLGLNLDIGSFASPDPYADIEAVVHHAVTWQIKEEVQLPDRREKADLGRIAAIVKRARYRGYLPLETLGEGDPRIKLQRFIDQVRTAFA